MTKLTNGTTKLLSFHLINVGKKINKVYQHLQQSELLLVPNYRYPTFIFFNIISLNFIIYWLRG